MFTHYQKYAQRLRGALVVCLALTHQVLQAGAGSGTIMEFTTITAMAIPYLTASLCMHRVLLSPLPANISNMRAGAPCEMFGRNQAYWMQRIIHFSQSCMVRRS
jgi:hypothetical protein